MDPKDLFEKLVQQENEVFSGEKTFIAPILATNSMVATRVASIVYTFRIVTPKNKREAGWHIFRARNAKEARIVGPAELDQIVAYQKLFPRLRLILVHRMEDHWLGIPADGNCEGQAPIRVYLAQGVEQFDGVDCIFDKKQAWYTDISRSRDPFVATTLREHLEKNNKTPKIEKLVPADRYAYALAYAFREEALKSNTEKRLEKQLEIGGAKLKKYTEQAGGTLAITLSHEGRDYQVNVRSSDLTVISSGICLSGKDKDFDLGSLPSVFSEKNRRDRGGYDDDPDDYDD